MALFRRPWTSIAALLRLAIASYSAPSRLALDAHDSPRKAPFITFRGIVGGFILGTPEFVNWVKDTFLRTMDDMREIPQLRELKPSVSIEKVINAVCREFGCDAESVIRKGRKKNLPRDIAIYLARDLTGRAAIRLGRYFGKISGPAITP